MGFCLLESCLYINEACRRNRSAYLSFIFLFTLFHLPHSVCPRVSIIFHRLTQFLVAMETLYYHIQLLMGKWRSFAKGASETGNKKQMKMKKKWIKSNAYRSQKERTTASKQTNHLCLLEANIESRHQCPRIPFVQQGDTGGIWQNGITFVWFEMLSCQFIDSRS